MLNRIETNELIDAIDRKCDKSEKLSFLATAEKITVYRKNKRAQVTMEEIGEILEKNHSLLNEERSQFDLVAEFLINQLHKKNKPYSDLMDIRKYLEEETN